MRSLGRVEFLGGSVRVIIACGHYAAQLIRMSMFACPDRIQPAGSKAKVALFGSFGDGKAIVDPYYVRNSLELVPDQVINAYVSLGLTHARSLREAPRGSRNATSNVCHIPMVFSKSLDIRARLRSCRTDVYNERCCCKGR